MTLDDIINNRGEEIAEQQRIIALHVNVISNYYSKSAHTTDEICRYIRSLFFLIQDIVRLRWVVQALSIERCLSTIRLVETGEKLLGSKINVSDLAWVLGYSLIEATETDQTARNLFWEKYTFETLPLEFCVPAIDETSLSQARSFIDRNDQR